MMKKFLKILLVGMLINSSVFSNVFLAQAQSSEQAFTDTTQELLKQARKKSLNSQNLSKRKIILKRISKQCDPSKKPLPPECAKENFSKNNSVGNNKAISSKQGQSVKNINDLDSLPSKLDSVGGLSVGVATLGLTSLLLITGATVLTFFSVGGYGNDGSSSVGSSTGSSSGTAASTN